METKEAQAGAPEAAAPKDLVDQCRFFHVSLAGTCLILLLAVSAGLSNPDANAYRQISSVSTLTNKWNSGWLTGTVETTSKNKFEDFVVRKAKLRQLLLTYGPDHTYVTAQVETSWFLSADKIGDDKDRTSVTLEDFQNERGTTDIANLTDFIRMWDLLGSHPVLNSLEVIDGGSYYDGTSRYDLEEAADSSEYLNEKGINPQPISGSMYFFGAVLMNKPRALQLISQIEKIDPYSKNNVIYDQVRAEIGKARYDCFLLPSQKGGSSERISICLMQTASIRPWHCKKYSVPR